MGSNGGGWVKDAVPESRHFLKVRQHFQNKKAQPPQRWLCESRCFAGLPMPGRAQNVREQRKRLKKLEDQEQDDADDACSQRHHLDGSVDGVFHGTVGFKRTSLQRGYKYNKICAFCKSQTLHFRGIYKKNNPDGHFFLGFNLVLVLKSRLISEKTHPNPTSP